MLRPDLMLLTSKQSFMVGMLPETFDYCKHYIPRDIMCFDIDKREIKRNSREFIQATDSMIITLPGDSKDIEKYEFPPSLYVPKLKDLELKAKSLPGSSKSVEDTKRYANDIREHFLHFILVDLLDYKNCNYTHEEVFLSHKRRKEMTKEHFEFIKEFSKTQTFKNFQNMLKKCHTPQERRIIHLMENFNVKKGKIVFPSRKEESKEDPFELQQIQIDKHLNHLTFNNLQEKYYNESEFIPIKQIITGQKEGAASYRYTYFPKMLDVISTDQEVFKTI